MRDDVNPFEPEIIDLGSEVVGDGDDPVVGLLQRDRATIAPPLDELSVRRYAGAAAALRRELNEASQSPTEAVAVEQEPWMPSPSGRPWLQIVAGAAAVIVAAVALASLVPSRLQSVSTDGATNVEADRGPTSPDTALDPIGGVLDGTDHDATGDRSIGLEPVAQADRGDQATTSASETTSSAPPADAPEAPRRPTVTTTGPGGSTTSGATPGVSSAPTTSPRTTTPGPPAPVPTTGRPRGTGSTVTTQPTTAAPTTTASPTTTSPPTSPTSTAPTTGRPTTTTAPTTVAPQPDGLQTKALIVGSAGTVTITYGPDTMTLTSVERRPGWSHQVLTSDGEQLDIKFFGPDFDASFTAKADGGVLQIDIDPGDGGQGLPTQTKSFTVGDAGTVLVSYDSNRVTLRSVTPRPGWSHQVLTNRGGQLDIKFFGPGSDASFTLDVDDGKLQINIDPG